MKIEVVMPKMGESLQEGTILKWLKSEGEKVERDEMILEISTDKVDTEVPSPQSGTLVKILAQENETIEVGKVIAIIETEAEAGAKAPGTSSEPESVPAPEPEQTPASAPAPATGADTVPIVMPKMGESLQEGTILKWLKAVGEKVERDEMILEISTDKVDTEVPSPVAGTLVEILAQENETVEVGMEIARVATEGGSAPAAPQPAEAPKQTTAPDPPKAAPAMSAEDMTTEIPRKSGDRFYSPLVRSIAKAENVTLGELNTINGSGVEGRVTKQDILDYIENRQSKGAITEKPVSSPATIAPKAVAPVPKREVAKSPVTAITNQDNVEVIPMDRVRQLISEHMIMSKRTSAHVTSVAEADVTHIIRYREAHKDEFLKKEGSKLTFTPFFAKAAIDAVKLFPMVNVSVDGANILRHRSINLGFATALEDGNLIVPVIHNADTLNITGLARSVTDLSTRARSKRLNPEDIQGGTVTLTNVGTFGTLFGTPIINQPQAAIFGVGAIQKRPVVREIDGNDAIAIRHMVYLSITYDHRVIDGMLAGQCLAAMVKYVEGMNEDTIVL